MLQQRVSTCIQFQLPHSDMYKFLHSEFFFEEKKIKWNLEIRFVRQALSALFFLLHSERRKMRVQALH